jgi:hypothetical protein
MLTPLIRYNTRETLYNEWVDDFACVFDDELGKTSQRSILAFFQGMCFRANPSIDEYFSRL